MAFEWDDAKNIANYKKHGLWFEEAQTVWTDRHAIEFFDPYHNETEDRFLRIGLSRKMRVLLVVFCERKDGHVVRIISARKALPNELRDYEKGI